MKIYFYNVTKKVLTKEDLIILCVEERNIRFDNGINFKFHDF